MTSLNVEPNINEPSGFYAELLACHDGLEEDESGALDARLILILANHIGDRSVLTAELAAAQLKGNDTQPKWIPST